MPLNRTDHYFPTRSYPYRNSSVARSTGRVAEALIVDETPLTPGQLYAFVVGLDLGPVRP
jgi:hypothetical protein